MLPGSDKPGHLGGRQNWIEVGAIEGGRAAVDIEPFIRPAQFFHFVRLTDRKSARSASRPGADIDVVGVIGSILQFSLSGAVLFDFNRFDLKPEAKRQVTRIARKIENYPRYLIIVEGHTDGIGPDEKNRILSENRAGAVPDCLKSAGLEKFAFEVRGYGRSRPVAANETMEGRAKNRRVEIVLPPPAGGTP